MIRTRSPLPRRSFLRAGAVSIGLPLLDAMLPVGLRAERVADALRARRMVLITRPLGFHAANFFPEQTGLDYRPSRYLKMLEDFRGDFTVFSGLSHLGYTFGHYSERFLMSGTPAPMVRAGKATISLDQEVAGHVGGHTRHASLVLGYVGNGAFSYNRHGVAVPAEYSTRRAFSRLFIDGKPLEVAAEMRNIEAGGSILDGVRDQAAALARSLTAADRERVDLLLTSVREAEDRLRQEAAWAAKPKPKVPEAEARAFATDPDRMIDREERWYSLVHLALQTDSSRVVSLFLWSHADPLRMEKEGVTLTHHDASHHGQDEHKLAQLAVIEEAEMKRFAGFLGRLRETDDGGASLLDRTVVLNASNLGNASSHANDNLPVILAGGGFRHAGHVAFDRKENRPLSDLFVRIQRQMGLEAEKFGGSERLLDEV